LSDEKTIKTSCNIDGDLLENNSFGAIDGSPLNSPKSNKKLMNVNNPTNNLELDTERDKIIFEEISTPITGDLDNSIYETP
jgi:hypothetical protein